MELRHLEHFLAVAEELSFTRAAGRVHIVQSALSASVRTLERELGAQLIDRSTHHVELTDAGHALVTEARRTLQAAEAARDAVAATVGGIRGTLRLGIMHSLAVVDLAGLLTRYHQDRPGVRIEPRAANANGSVELADAVGSGRLDLAFAAMPAGYPAGLEVRPLVAEPLSLACPPGHRLASRRRIRLAELAGERFVDFPPGWGTRRSVDQLFAAHGLDREVAVEIADIVVVSELVRAGFGLAFLTPSLLGTARDVRLIPVVPFPQFVVSLIRQADRPMSAAARAFWELTTSRYPGI
ncbi:LysR family transcriptional regulator [Streptomyces sp. NPDC020983]|uniref:LysR family transcriptional regulator n=1 Tax=Streptomyces sp. NPDC020983 TaxID=3365106 RepID=UPI0037ACB380